MIIKVNVVLDQSSISHSKLVFPEIFSLLFSLNLLVSLKRWQTKWKRFNYRGINILLSRKFWIVLVSAATLLTAIIFLFNINGTREKVLQLIEPDLIAENGHLKNENAYLKNELDSLNKLNRSLRKYLDLYEINFIELKDAVNDCYPIESMFPDDFPEELISERFEIRQLFRELLSEKKRWDQYQQEAVEVLDRIRKILGVFSKFLDLFNHTISCSHSMSRQVTTHNCAGPAFATPAMNKDRFVRCLFLHWISGLFPGFNPSPECRCIMITVL